MHSVKIETSFEAAHHLRGTVPPGHKCERPHGHSYIVSIVVSGELRGGMLVEFGVVKDAVRFRFDHQDLNEVLGKHLARTTLPPDAPPTAEVLAQAIGELVQADVAAAEVRETRDLAPPLRAVPRVERVDVQEGVHGGVATWVQP